MCAGVVDAPARSCLPSARHTTQTHSSRNNDTDPRWLGWTAVPRSAAGSNVGSVARFLVETPKYGSNSDEFAVEIGELRLCGTPSSTAVTSFNNASLTTSNGTFALVAGTFNTQINRVPFVGGAVSFRFASTSPSIIIWLTVVDGVASLPVALTSEHHRWRARRLTSPTRQAQQRRLGDPESQEVRTLSVSGACVRLAHVSLFFLFQLGLWRAESL